jgi:hypothetical protein
LVRPANRAFGRIRRLSPVPAAATESVVVSVSMCDVSDDTSRAPGARVSRLRYLCNVSATQREGAEVCK